MSTTPMFRLGCYKQFELRRHRHFETSFPHPNLPPCAHGWSNANCMSVCGTVSPVATTKSVVMTVTGSTPQQNVVRNKMRKTFTRLQAAKAMGIDWMEYHELVQAVPPAYTEYIGHQLMAALYG